MIVNSPICMLNHHLIKTLPNMKMISTNILNNQFPHLSMYIPKRYGQSRIDPCPFCKKDATTKNKQQVPVCYAHKASILNDLTCFCGDYLELKDGKFGIYFVCTNCGNINIKKALEMNPELGKERKTEEKKESKPTIRKTKPKEVTITSDDVDVNYS